MLKPLLRVEGIAIFILSVYFYSSLHYSWLVFITLLLVPDLSALGYLKSLKVGSVLYNLCHTYTMPISIMLYSLFFDNDKMLMISLIWIAHIGMDRIFGYGLKYPNSFHDNHLNRI